MKKNNKKIEILLIALLVVLIAGLGLTLYLRRNTIYRWSDLSSV